MGVDLSVARSAAQWLMTSTCTVHRDAEGVLDDELDEETLELSRPVGEPTLVFSGQCLVRRIGSRLDAERADGENAAGGEDRERPGYQVDLPHDAAMPERDDVITITACDDPELVDQELRIEEVRRTQWLVRRSVFAVAV